MGALLGTQNGREVEIVNTFELAVEDGGELVDHGFLVSRRDQCQISLSHTVAILMPVLRQTGVSFPRVYWLVHRRPATHRAPHCIA